MKEVIIELDDMYSEVLSITAIGKHGNITNISTKAVELSKGAILKFDGENWTQRKSKHTGVVLEDEEKEVASDLISRSALIKHLTDWRLQECPVGVCDEETETYKTICECIEAVKEQPVAYNVDAVVEHLKYKADVSIEHHFSVEHNVAIRTDNAIAIVRKGGV